MMNWLVRGGRTATPRAPDFSSTYKLPQLLLTSLPRLQPWNELPLTSLLQLVGSDINVDDDVCCF